MLTQTTKLTHTFEVYIPVSRARSEHKQRVVDCHGGLTIQHSIGLWRDAAGNVVEEPVYIYRWACGEYAEGHHTCTMLVQDLLAAGEQAVYWTYNGQAYITEKS